MAIHGGNIVATARSLGCRVTDLIDMSSNLTPLGVVPGLKEVLLKSLDQIAYLPETSSETLCRIFADKYGLEEGQVLAGNGTTEFIFALPGAFARDRAIIVNPTYSDYRLACSWANVPVVDFMLSLEEDFAFDLNRLAEDFKGGELVFICNPNNPTGRLTESSDLHEMITRYPDTFFLVDESYMPFTRESSLLHLDLPPNLFILCSLSKIYGIPGLRLGFLVASVDNLSKMSKLRKPWGVNRVAQLAGEFLLPHGDNYIDEVCQFLENERPRFIHSLSSFKDIHVIPGKANFILCHLRGEVLAEEIRGKLLQEKIMIRNCASFDGLDEHYFRMSLKQKRENDLCLQSLARIFKSGNEMVSLKASAPDYS